VTDVTLVMRRSAGSAGPGLRLALTSPAVAGQVRLQAVATIEPPGQAVAVWSVDGARIGTSVWTGSGREWRTEITATLAAGVRLVQVAYGVMIASDSLTVEDTGGGGGPVARVIKLSNQQSFTGQRISNGPFAVSTINDSVTISGQAMLFAELKSTNSATVPTPDWAMTGTSSPTAAQLAVWAAGNVFVMRFDGCPAGTYEVTAEVFPEAVYGPVTITVT
jgi:hypothetical protein